MRWLILFICVCPALVSAASSIVGSDVPYEILPIDEIDTQRSLYGELTGWPHTWQVIISEPTELRSRVLTHVSGPQVFSQIVIKEERRGVSEVGRRSGNSEEWSSHYDWETGLRLQGTSVLSASLEPGVYRLEVSAPDNFGKYRFDIGTVEAKSNVFSGFSEAWRVNNFFGRPLGAIKSPYVFGMFSFILVFWIAIRYRPDWLKWLVAFIALAWFVYFAQDSFSETFAPDEESDLVACPADAKLCADGSSVGRVGPSCEFPACPGGSEGGISE